MLTLKTIDAHGGGAPLRLVVEGFPAPRGRTMVEKLTWARRHADLMRRAIVLAPRGHADMTGAVLTEPVSPGSHAGVLFMHNNGFAAAVDHGLVSVTTIALERGLIGPGGDGRRLVLDTVSGTMRADAVVDHETDAQHARVRKVTCTLVPCFVVAGGLVVRVGNRAVPIDVASAGACYAVVDSEAAGVGFSARHVAEMRRTSVAILSAIRDRIPFAHPSTGLQGLQGVVFTGPAGTERADLSAALVFGDGQVAVSPTESASAAVLAVLEAIGLVADGSPITLDSLTGVSWTARIASRTRVGDYEAIVPEVEGAAWVTGEHTFLIQSDDPLAEGISL